MTTLPDEAALQSTALDRVIDSVRSVVLQGNGPDETARLVAAALQPFLTDPDLLPAEYRRGDPTGYRQHLMHAEEDGSFSIVALVWQPGQHTSIHDHVSWCVTGVYQGVETEYRYELRGSGENQHLVPGPVVVNGPGSSDGFAPPGDIHLVTNAGSTPAISVHIYGADISRLGTSIRRRYDLPIRDAA
ncbi:cysteine dioxygenase [Streptomyces sp. NPDC057555]|uniref:cysteine dioxygenase family protein n=1 Tax=Streptomyces sp. NPDC057555 TaxID=3346166 RepID=UPI0036A0B97B